MASDRANEVKMLLIKAEKIQQAHERAIADKEKDHDDKYEKLLREYQAHRERLGKQMNEQVNQIDIIVPSHKLNSIPMSIIGR